MNDRLRFNRRDVLRAAGSVFALSALSVRAADAAAAADDVSAPMTRLSQYMQQARARMLPDEVVEVAKQHILDTLAAMISGSQLAPGRFALRFAREQRGDAVATVAASSLLCSTIEAAFANAMMAQADETDDSHAPSQSHPGCSVVPSAWAAAERFSFGGADLIRCVVLGYDVGTRVAMAVGNGGFQTENHMSSHAVAGCFGSAAATGCAARLNAQQVRWMLDYASQEASGIKTWQRDSQHVEKAFLFAGMPARAGVTAALLVQAGATGVSDAFSGADNFLDVYGPHVNHGVLIDKLGERYEIVQTNIKKWTVGSPIQAPLDAITNMRKRQPFTADQVAKVAIRVAPSEGMLVDNREVPDICMQHMVAVMLLDGTASFRAAHDTARMSDPAVRRERDKVALILDPELEKLLPARVALVQVTLSGGQVLSERVDAVRGTAQNPMTRAEVVAKCKDLMSPVLGADRSGKLIDALLKLEAVDSIRTLRPLLQLT